MIGMASYTGLYKPIIEVSDILNVGNWGYSFIIGWIAFCVTLISGCVTVANEYLREDGEMTGVTT